MQMAGVSDQESMTTTSLNKLRILLVDDKEDHFIMTRRLFDKMRRGAYVLEWVPTYEAALDAIERDEYGAYLVDNHLGIRSGLDLIWQARQIGCQMPMILFTSGDDPNADLQALEVGATDYLAKGKIDSILLERTLYYAIEHTRQLQALRSSEQFTQTNIDSAGEGVVVYDADLTCTVWNAFMQELTGLPSNEMLGPIEPYLFEQLYSVPPHPLLNQILAGETTSLPEQYFRIKDHKGWITATFRPITGKDGQPPGVVVTVHDDTQRKLAQSAQRETEERLQIAINAAEMGTVDWDMPANTVTYGGHFETLFHIDPPKPPQTFEDVQQYVHPDDQSQVRLALLKSSKDGSHFDIEFRLRPNGDDERWVSAQGEVYQDTDGTPVRMSGVVQDITERKLIERDRTELLKREQEARRLSEEANDLKLRFLAMVSHELRTPLTSIKGFTSTLLADDVEWSLGQYREFTGIIDVEADKLTDLVAQLMDVSRLQAGVMPITMEPHPVSALIQGALPQLDAAVQHHNLTISVPDDLPLIMVDRRRIEQVLVNLVENAAKYSPPGTDIRIIAAPVNKHVQIDIDDQGEGIPPEHRERVFEAFQQLSNHKKGAGLGLAICRGLVEAHGGQIWIADKDTPGTRVSFTLAQAS